MSYFQYVVVAFGLGLGNFIYAWLWHEGSVESAVERTFFQCVALLAAAVIQYVRS